jgi:hypothetical protein
MRAPFHKRSTDKCIDDEGAIEEASRRLRRLFLNVISWSERGAETNIPKKALSAAIALVQGALGDAEHALNEAKRALEEAALNESALNERAKAKEAVANVIPFIKIARTAAIPELRQARPRKGRWGQRRDLNASRNQTIADTVASICDQFDLSQEQASSIVSEALKSLVSEHRRVFSDLTKERPDQPERIPADPAWIDECLKFVNKLWLSEDTVEDIAKVPNGS